MTGAAQTEASSYVGRHFGDFVVREPLSAGGFGLVFRAEQPLLGREAVVKVLHARLRGSDTVVQRFLREARLASQLDHPYAAHTYAFGAEPDGVLWIAMELVRGTPLDKLLDAQGPIPLERFVPLFERLCEVVHTAHEQGIVHRDLKPGNVMVLSRAGRLLPKLLDLGIARGGGEPRTRSGATSLGTPVPDGSLDETAVGAVAAVASGTPAPAGSAAYPGAQTGETLRGEELATPRPRAASLSPGSTTGDRLTQHGAIMGSPLYMAPEQWADAGAAEARSDIYALGVLAFEALTGRPPFVASSTAKLAQAHARAPVPPLGSGLPRELDAVILRALAKRPEERFDTALDLAAAFRVASGLAPETVDLPRLPEALRGRLVASAPMPLARAVAALDGARNPHQARDAMWQVVRTATRWLGVVALASHAHVGAGSTDPVVSAALVRLREPSVPDLAWLDLGRELVRPFGAMREAHPMPELVDALLGRVADGLRALLERRAAAEQQSGEADVVELLAEALPQLATILGELEFLAAYPVAVAHGGDARTFHGLSPIPIRVAARPDRPLDDDQPALLDAYGAPVVSLWPFVQLHAPMPGAPEALFLFDGRSRRGARLVALPDRFEHEDEDLWESFGGMLGAPGEAGGAAAPDDACPFPGLASFTREEAARFVGREREAEGFLNRLRAQPLIAVVGPSGAGKSSFVQAGVLPALGDEWLVVTVRPGPTPFVALAARLQAAGIGVATDLRAEVVEHPGVLGTVLRLQAGSRKGRVLLVVDQFEELFTLCDDSEERALFAEALARAARSADDPIRVVLTLRDDFLVAASALPALRHRLDPALQLLATPARTDLLRILTEPVRRAGYDFDDAALPGEMVDAVAGAPNALALLSFTASKLWELRDRRFRLLGRKAYDSLGGVGGALAQHADALLDALRPDEQRLVREIFRHLVTAEGTRAVLSRAELGELFGDAAQPVLEKLVAARLLATAEDERGGERVEIAHEALLAAWPRLVAWRREDADGDRLRDQLRTAARQWEDRGRADALLWRDEVLAEYRAWRARHPDVALTASEGAFGGASVSAAERARRRRTAVVSVAIATLMAGVIVLFLQNRRVGEQRELAIAAREEADRGKARFRDLLRSQYEDQGRRLVLADDPLQALAYLEAAAHLGAGGVAHELLVGQALEASAGERFRVTHDDGIVRVRFSRDGARLITSSYDKTARIWDAATGAPIATLPHDNFVFRAEHSPDGRLLATAAYDGTVALWDARTGASVAKTRSELGGVAVAMFAPDGARLVTVGTNDAVQLWSVPDLAPIATLRGGAEVPPNAKAIAMSRDGVVAVGDELGVVRLWSTATGRPVAALEGHAARVAWVDFAPDGRALLSASKDGTARVWDLATRRPRVIVRHRGGVTAGFFAPDGRTFATGSADRTAAVWDAADGAPRLSMAGHDAEVRRVLFSPDGRLLLSLTADGTAQLWDTASGDRYQRLPGHRNDVRDAAFTPDSARVATVGQDGVAIVSDVAPRRGLALDGPEVGTEAGLAYSPDGALLAVGGVDGRAIVWDAASGAVRQSIVTDGDAVESLAFDPSGRMLALGGTSGAIRVFDVATGRALRRLEVGATVGKVRFVDDALLASDQRGYVSVFGPGDDQPRLRRKIGDGHLVDLALTREGQLLFMTRDQRARWVDLDTGETVREIRSAQPADEVRPSPDGRAMLLLSPAGVRVTDPELQHVAFELAGSVIRTVAWHPRERLIATAGSEGSASLWDGETGKQIGGVSHTGEDIWYVAFAPDGRHLAYLSSNGRVRVWPVPRFRGDAAALTEVVRCRAPHRLQGELLVPRTDTDGCR